MRSSFFGISGLLLFILTAASLPAQRGGGGGGGANNVPTPTAAELIVHGSVVLPDAVIPERLVRVEKLCGGRVEATTYADSRGRFSFSLGLMEQGPASFGQGTSSPTTSSISGAAAVAAAQNGGTAGKVVTARDVKDCSVRASLSGYHPQSVALEPVLKNQNTNLGELSFKPLGEKSSLLSATDATIPANAKKEYEKGLDAVAKSKWKDGMAAMEKATSDYGKYATAWLGLGMLQAGQKQADAALRSYSKAIAADEKFAPAYVELADLEAASGQWDKVIEHTNKAIALDPDSFGRAYYLNAMANIRLNHSEPARRSVAEGLRVDPDHEYPDLAYIDGVLLMTGGDNQGARKRFESYVTMAPDGTNAAQARQLLTELTPK